MKSELRSQLKKIAWQHYDPHASINVEDMLDEMLPIIQSQITAAEERGYEKAWSEASTQLLTASKQAQKEGQAAYHKRVMDEIDQEINYYMSVPNNYAAAAIAALRTRLEKLQANE